MNFLDFYGAFAVLCISCYAMLPRIYKECGAICMQYIAPQGK